jgi:hypothetical protein
MSVVAEASIPVRVAVAGERFYVRMAATCVAVAFIGFAPTYWVPLLRGTLDVPPLAHVHAILLYGWTLLSLRLTWLAASGEMTRHREMGVAGVALATAMLFVGLATAIVSLKRSEAAGFGAAARPFAIVSVTSIVLFAVMFTIAVLNVRKPEVHKRVMLVATISLLQAAVARWFLLFLAPSRPPGAIGPASPPPVPVTLLPGLVVDFLIVAAMIHDRRTTGRVHPAYWIAGGCLLAVQVLRVPLSTTGAWLQGTPWLVALLP